MESKICTYSEPNVRLQLVRIQEGSLMTIELRYNRRIIRSFNREESQLARLFFSYQVGMLLVDRNASGLLKITKLNT